MAENSATTDFLTGMLNARSLFLHLDREIGRCRREKAQLALLVCDLDGFKQVNDRFGHLEGNKVLKRFAETVKQACRDYDCVARMGGDEFVIVSPGLTAAAAVEMERRVATLAREAGLAVCHEDLLSVSIGNAFFPDDGDTAEDLLSEADRRMYTQKQERHSQRPELRRRPEAAHA